MMEAAHTGAAMMAGITLAHTTQMRKIIRRKRCDGTEKQIKRWNIGTNLPFAVNICRTLGAPLHASAIETLQVYVESSATSTAVHCIWTRATGRVVCMGRGSWRSALTRSSGQGIATIDIPRAPK
jgi:hypothetical protein